MPVGIGLGRLSGSRVTGRVGASTNLRYISQWLAMRSEDQIAMWALTDTSGVAATDLSGNGIDGVYRNSAGVLSGVALSSKFINNSAVPAFTSGFVNLYSVAFNTSFPRSKGTIFLCGFADTWLDDAQKYMLCLEIDTDNRIRIYKFTDGILYIQYKANNVTKTATVAAANFSNGVPYSVCIAWDTTIATPAVAFYFDGQKIQEDTASVVALVGDFSSTRCTIGAGSTVPTNTWVGAIGFVGLWGERLLETEIRTLSKKVSALPANYAAEGLTIAVLPDTQHLTASNTAESQIWMLTDAIKWIAENAAAYNIQAVVQNGDLVHTATSNLQWEKARQAADIIKASPIPYSWGIGNHDLIDLTNPANYNAYFGQSYYTDTDWWNGGFYEDGHAENHWFTFDYGGDTYLVLHLQYVPTADMLTWANGILVANPTAKALVFTHDFLTITGEWSAAGTAIWNALSGNDNIVMFHCGHAWDVNHRTDDNANSHPILQIAANYQNDMINGYFGYGYFRLISICPGIGKIKVQTYSPVLHQVLNDSAHTFDLDYQF